MSRVGFFETFFRTTLNPALSFYDKAEQVLTLATQALDLEAGYFARKEGTGSRVVAAFDPSGRISVGSRCCAWDDTYIGETEKTVECVVNTPSFGIVHPLFGGLLVRSSISSKVGSKTEQFGVVELFSSAIRDIEFSDEECSIISCVCQWLAAQFSVHSSEFSGGEKSRARLRRIQQLEALEVFTVDAAHELNNVLVGILGNAGLALMDVSDNPNTKSRLISIEKSAQRSARLANQLLSFTGQVDRRIEQLDLGELAAQVLEVERHAIVDTVHISFESRSGLPMTIGDSIQIKQILWGLLNNAIESLPNLKGEVDVSLGVMHASPGFVSSSYANNDFQSGDYLYMRVCDSGSGIDERFISRIFDPFFTTKLTSRGLNLSTILSIVLAHGGAINVKSELGKGSAFTVLFPMSQNLLSAQDDEQSSHVGCTDDGRSYLQPGYLVVTGGHDKDDGTTEVSLRSPLILVADDEEVVRSVAAEVLEKFHFRVLSAENGTQAVDLFRRHADEIDAVVLDVTMPDLGGEQVLRLIKDIKPETTVIVSSGYFEASVMSDLKSTSYDNFIHKPYSPLDLVELVKRVIKP